jgi:hypothetical protein
MDCRVKPGNDEGKKQIGGPGAADRFGADRCDAYPAAPVSSRIGPNSSQRSPLNFIICNCLLTR